MDDQSSPHHVIEKTTTEARQGVTTGTVRRVLAISMVGVILGMVIAFWLVHHG